MSFMNMLRKFLGPDGSKGTFGSDGMTLRIPADQVTSSLGVDTYHPLFSADKSQPSFTNPSKITSPGLMTGGGLSTINPFVGSQPDFSKISGADLAGLTPQDISSALSAKFTLDQLKNKSVTDIVDMIYKQRQIDVLKPIYTIPGTDIKLTTEQYLKYKDMTKEEKSAAVKNYEYAKKEGFKGSFMEFQDAAQTTHQKDYKEAVAGGYKGSFNTWLLGMAKARGTHISLNTKLEEKKKMEKLTGQTYFYNSKWIDDVKKHISSEDVQNKMFKSKNPNDVEIEETVRYIQSKIIAGGGDITRKYKDNKGNLVWAVEWPSGDKEEIKYTS